MEQPKRPPIAERGKYGEQKRQMTVRITPTAQELLRRQAQDLDLAVSEMIEQVARGKLRVEPSGQLLGESPGN